MAPHGGPSAGAGLGCGPCGAGEAGEIKTETAIIKRCPACAGAAPQRRGAGPSAVPKHSPKLCVGPWGCRAGGWLHSPRHRTWGLQRGSESRQGELVWGLKMETGFSVPGA